VILNFPNLECYSCIRVIKYSGLAQGFLNKYITYFCVLYEIALFGELPHQRKERNNIPIQKKCDKTDCSNYRGIILRSISYIILSNILLSTLTPYADENLAVYQCEYGRKRTTTDQIIITCRYRRKIGV
jgi:hypothetical protein